jgi:hypothetical protein
MNETFSYAFLTPQTQKKFGFSQRHLDLTCSDRPLSQMNALNYMLLLLKERVGGVYYVNVFVKVLRVDWSFRVDEGVE